MASPSMALVIESALQTSSSIHRSALLQLFAVQILHSLPAVKTGLKGHEGIQHENQ
jgi:hypothetical protein